MSAHKTKPGRGSMPFPGQILPFDCDRGECARSVASDLDVRVTDYQEQPALDASSARRAAPGLEDLSISSFGAESGLNRRIDRVIRIISNKSLVFGATSGTACSVTCR